MLGMQTSGSGCRPFSRGTVASKFKLLSYRVNRWSVGVAVDCVRAHDELSGR